MSTDLITAGDRSGGDAGGGECGAGRARSAACRRHAGRQAACRGRASSPRSARPSPPAQRDAAERMARRLQALAQENKRLLERAIAVQGRVIGVIARAARRAAMAPHRAMARRVARPARGVRACRAGLSTTGGAAAVILPAA